MQRYVFATRSVTLFTYDAEDQAALAIVVGRRRGPFKITGMTLEASRNDYFVEVRRTVGITGAVHPAVGLVPIRDGQLEKLVAFPEKIALAFARLASDDVDPLGA